MKKKISYFIIILLVSTSLSPTIMGLVKNTPRSINYIQAETKYLNIYEQKNLRPIEKVCEFYDFKINNQFFYENTNHPIFSNGYFDYTLKGFITDETTGLPIEDASILIISYGKHFCFERYETTTDSTGYYEINLEHIFLGFFYNFISAEGYYSQYDVQILLDLQVKWVNQSLKPGAPEKNSVVNGYVYHADNAEPIEGAVVDIYWRDNNGHAEWIYAFTDDTGFFSVNVAEGEAMPYVYAEEYYQMEKPEKSIGAEETVEFILHLYPRYPDSAMICGYITEEQSGEPIEDVLIELDSYNQEIPHGDFNLTFTDADGYYEIMVAESDFNIWAITYHHTDQPHDDGHINEGETYYWNETLYAIPPQTAKITGYITDNNTSEPIKGVDVYYHWRDDQGHYYSSSDTMTDYLGYYNMNIASGEFSIRVSSSEYYYFRSEYDLIEDNETLLVNISLEPYPPKNSVVKGYIKSNTTTLPIVKDARVYAHSYDVYGDRCGGNNTLTDDSGYYEMNIAAGDVYLSIYADGHYNSWTEEFPIQDGETLHLDVVIQPVLLNICLKKPIPGIYLNNHKLFPFIFPIIIGNLDIQVNGSEELYEVEFYIDGQFKRADRYSIYNYLWDEVEFGFHNIKLICNGGYDQTVIKNIRVLKLF